MLTVLNKKKNTVYLNKTFQNEKTKINNYQASCRFQVQLMSHLLDM